MDTTQTPEAKPYKYLTTTAAKMAKRGPFVPCTLSAEVLFESLPADGSVEIRWEGFGHVHGVERFGTHQMRRAADGRGVEVLRVSPGSQTGHLETILVHPLGKGRTVRTFRKARPGEL